MHKICPDSESMRESEAMHFWRGGGGGRCCVQPPSGIFFKPFSSQYNCLGSCLMQGNKSSAR